MAGKKKEQPGKVLLPLKELQQIWSNKKVFYGKDLKEADDYIKESSVHKELGLLFSCRKGKATSDQLKELLAILGKLEHKKIRVLNLWFGGNPNLTNSLMV